MEKQTRLKQPIIFHHMHAGTVNPFIHALDDALEMVSAVTITLYGVAQDQQGAIHDLSEGRELALTGTIGDVPPYWQLVCLTEHDLDTLTLVRPAGEERYWWDEVMFCHPAASEENIPNG